MATREGIINDEVIVRQSKSTVEREVIKFCK